MSFDPDWVSPPGDTIQDIINERGISIKELADLLGVGQDYVEQLIEGNIRLTLGVANQLEKLSMGSATFWITREKQYRDLLGEGEDV